MIGVKPAPVQASRLRFVLRYEDMPEAVYGVPYESLARCWIRRGALWETW